MSIKTWIEEFYPVDASRSTGTELEAVEHSLRKWRGLSRENLAKHEVWHVLGAGMLVEDDYDACNDVMFVDSGTCALCRRHYSDSDDIECSRCSLSEFSGEDCHLVFHKWKDYSNNLPMVKALESCKAKLLQSSANEGDSNEAGECIPQPPGEESR